MKQAKTNIKEQLSVKSLLDMANGAVKERIAYEMPKILANITDPNTSPKKQRTLTITVKLTPTEDRQFVALSYGVSTKLQPTDPIPSTLMLQTNGEDVHAVEIGKSTPGQGDLFGGEEPQPAILQQIK